MTKERKQVEVNAAEAPELMAEEKVFTYDKQNRVVSLFIQLGGAGISLFILATMLFLPLPAMIQRASILMLALFVIFLLYPMFKRNRALNVLNWAWAISAVVVCGYVLYDFQDLVYRMGDLNTLDMVFGGLCIFMVLDATRRSIGWPLVVVTSIFLLYSRFGYLIPGSFGHRGYDLERIINQMFMTTEGIFGVPLGVIVTIVFLFILFGTLLEKGGGGKFFIDLAIAMAGRLRGGPAKICVCSSALMGTISGSSIANVVTTGTFTIPLMKRIGYRPEFAAAVEAAASTGGQIMPPVMGAAAFIMSEFTQTPYTTIILMATIPAILYFLSIYMNVHFEACRVGMKGLPEDEIPKKLDVLKGGWHYVLPVISLIIVLMNGNSAARSAFVGMSVLLVSSMIKKSTRLSLRDLSDVLITAGKNSVGIIAACACAGMIVGVTSITGLGVKLATMIEYFSGGHLIIALILTAVASIIMGMALPTTPNYIVQATVAAPALMALGVPMLTAHLFVFYFGVFADITPPVALASYTASGIAKSEPMATALLSSRHVIVGFLVPILFVYYPSLLMQGPVLDIILVGTGTALAVVAYSAAVANFFHRKCLAWERAVLLISCLTLVYPERISSMAGLILLGGLYLYQRSFSKVPIGVPGEAAA